ncbi:apoptosis-stimulating of p53 protein 1-like [Limulus polyphemus]|uniref:Apoptosis-stimulating of p53 protein 1-like n=1 Tax=Limulus polyphemus TaxID=6850 RepID=A0ABM1T030_LIMPO|nr:apoptosis-stimulating of p53 protein 1-like [Limulus polyphemus]
MVKPSLNNNWLGQITGVDCNMVKPLLNNNWLGQITGVDCNMVKPSLNNNWLGQITGVDCNMVKPLLNNNWLGQITGVECNMVKPSLINNWLGQITGVNCNMVKPLSTGNFLCFQLPEGAELTLAELREMAARQQQQIEAQQQLLVAKEQRLKFLKQQEVRHHQGVQTTEGDRLRHLRERVEGQEQKLRRLRALRNQVDQQRVNNGNLGAELDSIRALFNEKEKELSLAVAKVENLTRQLEELRRGNLNGLKTSNNNASLPAVLEVEKLKQELVYRTKLNEQQNERIAHQRETLAKRQEDISGMDQRIAELQQRLHRKRMLNQQMSNKIHAATVAKQAYVRTGSTKIHPRPPNTKIVAVEPLKQASVEPDRVQDDLDAPLGGVKGIQELSEFASNKNDPKYQTLPYNTKFTVKNWKDDTSSEENGEGPKSTEEETVQQSVTASSNTKQQLAMKPTVILPPPGKLSPLPLHASHLGLRPNGSIPGTLSTSTGRLSGNVIVQGQPSSNNLPSMTNSRLPPTLPKPKPTAQGNPVCISQPFSRTDVNPPLLHQSSSSREGVQSSTSPRRNGSSDGHQIVSVRETNMPTSTAIISTMKPSPPPKPPIPVKPVPPPRQTHHLAENGSSSERGYAETSLDSVDSALSILKGHGNQTSKRTNGLSYRERLLYYRIVMRYLVQPQVVQRHAQRVGQEALDQFAKAMNHVYRNEHPSRTPQFKSSGVRDNNFSTSDLSGGNVEHEDKREKLPIRPKPLTIKIPLSSDQPRVKGQQSVSTQKQGTEGTSSGRISPNQSVHVSINRRIAMPPAFLFPENHPPPTDLGGPAHKEARAGNDVTDRGVLETENLTLNSKHLHKSPPNQTDQLDQFNGNVALDLENVIRPDGDGDSVSTDNGQAHVSDQQTEALNEANGIDHSHMHNSAALRRVKKGNLKTKNSTKNSRRVSFDPLALLLDAALEGELELVKKTTREVPDASAANDEGITALHNAICAGHFEIVKFLVEFGCDVNAQDSDGWTPLHCAASCNNQPMVRFLVEHGACVFASTLSDHDTAAEKCEEDEEGYDGCSEFLYSVQEKLGILNGGAVYAVYDYDAQNQDELSFKDGDMIVVLRKGDEQEREWWWSRLKDREGYIPRNLLGLYPRVTAKRDS